MRDGGSAADPFDVDLNGDGGAGLLCRTTAQAASEIRWFDQVPGTRTTMRKTLAYEPMRVAGPGDKLARARSVVGDVVVWRGLSGLRAVGIGAVMAAVWFVERFTDGSRRFPHARNAAPQAPGGERV